KCAKDDAEAMLALVSMRSFEVYSTLSQFKRYELWSGLQHPEAQRLIQAIVSVLAAEGEPPHAGHADAPFEGPGRGGPPGDGTPTEPPESDDRLIEGDAPAAANGSAL